MITLLKSDLERYYSLVGKSANVSKFGALKAFFNIRLMPVAFIRLAYWCAHHHMGPISKIVCLLNLVVFGLEYSAKVKIGPGLFLPHTVGTVIGAASIGANATIFQGVTIGAKEADMNYCPERRPTILDDVIIGAGAKILGGITIGEGSKIGANAVVLNDVPAGRVAVGIPARII
ncbi:serine O-acetyltransferase [Pseudomonas sp. URMO17WK12:I12]|uniref:serine O-acetyltransferase n=1 Tax=Pseudomonas sp. URMO17WK12:I12 TaxID=1259797 RepID=UPI00047FF458|nr:DapH/DapD/GlmU-related protein [Pseudomonas sp. URMO17WK12:I12]